MIGVALSGRQARGSGGTDWQPLITAREDLDFYLDENESMRHPTGASSVEERPWGDQEGARADIRSAPQARSAGFRRRRQAMLGVGENALAVVAHTNRMEAR